MTEMSETAVPGPKPRPTSPHLSIYRLEITSALSIIHRLTGIVLAIGLLFLTWWAMAVLFGPNAYAIFLDFTRSILGRLFLIGWSWALFYHMLNGVRHLFWDMGKGFDMQSVTQTGIMVLLGSVILTAGVWLLAFTTAPQGMEIMHG